ncbi:MAG: hypothetical protein NNA31_05655 [Nitrospira sp.]|nr:hypothetical protein [Nitrospira sp.]
MSINHIGYWSGVAAFTAAAAYGIVQILQVVGVLRFPADEILIYGTSLLHRRAIHSRDGGFSSSDCA